MPEPEFRVLPWRQLTPADRRRWLDLLTREQRNISLGPEFIETAAEAHGLRDRVQVAMAESAGELTAVQPFHFERRRVNGVPLRVLAFSGNLASYHQDALGSDWPALFRHCLAEVWRGWDLLSAAGLLEGSVIEAELRRLGRGGRYLQVIPGERSPYLPLPETIEALLQTRRRKFRNRYGRVERRLQEAGRLECRWFENPGDCDELYRTILAIEGRSWKVGADMAITGSVTEQRYIGALLPRLAEQGWLFANVEYLDGQPIAYVLCYRHAGRVGQIKTTYDQAYQRHEVGFVSIKHSLSRALEAGVREYDFLGDLMPHKALWTRVFRRHHNCFLYNRTPRGLLLGMAKRLRDRRRPPAAAPQTDDRDGGSDPD